MQNFNKRLLEDASDEYALKESVIDRDLIFVLLSDVERLQHHLYSSVDIWWKLLLDHQLCYPIDWKVNLFVILALCTASEPAINHVDFLRHSGGTISLGKGKLGIRVSIQSESLLWPRVLTSYHWLAAVWSQTCPDRLFLATTVLLQWHSEVIYCTLTRWTDHAWSFKSLALRDRPGHLIDINERI